jgi:hypothetical protein
VPTLAYIAAAVLLIAGILLIGWSLGAAAGQADERMGLK